MVEILPAETGNNNGNTSNGNGGQFLQIGNLHYHGNDLRELRLLAESSPEIAKEVISQRDKENSRTNISYRFGLTVSVITLGMMLASVTVLLIYKGILPTLALIVCLLAVALFVRVILTGQWSDTSWFGKFLTFLIKLLGGKRRDDDLDE